MVTTRASTSEHLRTSQNISEHSEPSCKLAKPDGVLPARKHGPKVAWLTLLSMECKNIQELQNIGSKNCQAGRRSLEFCVVSCRIRDLLPLSLLKASAYVFKGNWAIFILLELESAKSTVSPPGLPN
jgi:hypothetical protein